MSHSRRHVVDQGIVIIAILFFRTVWAGADPETPEKLSGRLLYSRLTGGTWQVWRHDLATDTQEPLTTTPGDKRSPAWAPRGQAAYCTTDQACFLHRPDGVELPLMASLRPLRWVAWSSDGRWMAFAKFHADVVDNANLWIARAEGQSPRLLTQGPGIQTQVAWSPDGTQLAYAAGQGPESYDIYSIRADGTHQRQLTSNHANDFLPAWSPDGVWIAWSSNISGDYEIWIMRADGSQPRQVTHSPGLDTHPTWSPDGRHIAFATNRSGALEIWVMRPDGAGQHPLETAAQVAACDPTWQ